MELQLWMQGGRATRMKEKTVHAKRRRASVPALSMAFWCRMQGGQAIRMKERTVHAIRRQASVPALSMAPGWCRMQGGQTGKVHVKKRIQD
eukprot:1160466-Pelagomonas_calceolata.AAC.7